MPKGLSHHHASRRQTNPPVWLDLAFLTAIIGILLFCFLGTRPLFVPDEGRYAEIAREMASSGDFITPTLNGIIYFEKPALFYWVGAYAFKLFGVNLWSIRSINAIFALLGCLLTYGITRTLYNRVTGIWAALIQASCLLYFIMAHMVSLDLPVTFFLSGCLYAFLLGTQTTNPTLRRLYFYLAASAAAFAVLTKGLIGIVFPTLIIGTWTLLAWRKLRIRDWPIFTSLIVFAAIATPWHVLVQLQHPQFFHFYIIEQHFLRYTDLTIGHYEPVWFFIPYLIIGLIPWVIFLPGAIKMAVLESQRSEKGYLSLFFLLWACLVFAFFSFSKSKLIPYMLPMFPPLCVLTARYVVQHYSNRTRIALFALSFFAFISLMAIFPRYDTRTIKPLADIIAPIIKPNDEVITYNQYFQDLPFYLQREVNVLNWQNELKFGTTLQDKTQQMIDDTIFLKRFKSSKRVFVVMSKSEFEQFKKKYPKLTPYLLGTTQTNALISNQPS